MFINEGARNVLLQGERHKFLAEEWPRIQANIQRLGLNTEELLSQPSQTNSKETTPPSNKQEEEP
jgi:GntR family transcriptional regulator